MKTLLCQPVGELLQPSVHIRMCYVEPLGLEYVSAAAAAAGHHCRIAYPLVGIEAFTRELIEWQPDVLALSVYTYASDEALQWAKCAKEVLPSVVIIAGGHHATAVPGEMLSHGVDYAVLGEGEESFVALLKTLEEGKEAASVAGVALMRNGRMECGPPRQRIRNCDGLPRPTRLPQLLAQAKNYQIIFPPPSQQVNLAQVSYARGCRNNCDYCSSPQMWDRKIVWRNPAAVLDEVAWLQETYGTNVVYFPDLELNPSRKKLHELCDEFQRRDLSVHWWGLFSLSGLDDSVLDHLHDAGCVKLSIGVEGVGNQALRRLGCGRSSAWCDVKERFEAVQARGLITRAFIMIGNEWDTPEYYDLICHELAGLAADDLRVSFTTPFPGTRLYRDTLSRGVIEITDWSRYTTEEPILRNPVMPRLEMFRARQRIIDSFYGSPQYRSRVLDRASSHQRLRLPYLEYFQRLLNQGGLTEKAKESIMQLASALSAGAHQIHGMRIANEGQEWSKRLRTA